MDRTRITIILLLYLVLAATIVYGTYYLLPPTTPDQFKEFGVLGGIGLAALGAFFSMLIALSTANAQMKAARDLQKNQISAASDLEDKKEEILSRIEDLRGEITRQNEFLNRTLDTKSNAYNKLFIASNYCYRELQNLAKGQYDKQRAQEGEQLMREAEGLAANLDDEDQKLVTRIMQIIMNINDEVENLTLSNDALKQAYETVWQHQAAEFGEVMVKLRNRSPFYNKSIRA